ncbi:MAG: polyprenyl synthetase family protein, partial [Syntrophorhabdaceae bacterium]|nr:polyprenyl synthetase family protein [Syntrophorhabdaceae bacterium]
LFCSAPCGPARPPRITMSVVAEYIHPAPLLHDDVVDMGTIRRGKPSANVVFGNSISVIVGDFLFARASQLMITDGDADVYEIFARTLIDIVEGEALQLTKACDDEITEKQHLDVVDRKTASLFAAACETGAVLAGADRTICKALSRYGRCVGMAFQLTDDILDYTGAEKKLGKRTFQDLREGKITLPLLHALQKADVKERGRALNMLAKKERGERDIAFLAGLVGSGGVEYAASRASDYIRRGKRYLRALPASEARDALAALSDYVVSRTS